MTDAPVRIQLKRTKGWRMPEGVVRVARPGVWGNPHWDIRWLGLDRVIALHKETMRGGWNPSLVDGLSDQRARSVYDDHCAYLKRFIRCTPAEHARHVLRGKSLACWCPLDKACHADFLLEIANP